MFTLHEHQVSVCYFRLLLAELRDSGVVSWAWGASTSSWSLSGDAAEVAGTNYQRMNSELSCLTNYLLHFTNTGNLKVIRICQGNRND